MLFKYMICTKHHQHPVFKLGQMRQRLNDSAQSYLVGKWKRQGLSTRVWGPCRLYPTAPSTLPSNKWWLKNEYNAQEGFLHSLLLQTSLCLVQRGKDSLVTNLCVSLCISSTFTDIYFNVIPLASAATRFVFFFL